MGKNELSQYISELSKIEQEIDEFKKRTNTLKTYINQSSLDSPTSSEEIRSIKEQNKKLQYRLTILNNSISTMEKKSSDCSQSGLSISINCILNRLFENAIRRAFPDLKDPPVVLALGQSNNEKFGDYQCNSAMAIANIYKQSGGKKISPRDVANSIVGNLEADQAIDKVEIAGVGFINIYLRRDYIEIGLKSMVQNGLVTSNLMEKQRILVDYSAPNIAKEMHVGHLRSTIIGESICRLLEILGHSVLRINHVGDWGTQFGMLIAHLQDQYPDYATKSPPIQNLQQFYKESKNRFDNDVEFRKRAYNCVVQLQTHQPTYIQAWQLICQVSRLEFQKIYDRLNIKSLVERGESFYQTHMEQLVKDFDQRGLLEYDEGRKIMWPIDGDRPPNVIPLTVVKSDGGFTYDTSDLAALKQRIEVERAQWLIYVTDAGQATHFQTLFQCATRVKLLNPSKTRIDHVGFGVVLGEDRKKFKTRSGDTVKLTDLLDEGLKRSLDTLLSKGRDKELTPDELSEAQEAVAYGCIKYADLSHNRNHEYVFSFEKMLEDKGNTAIYLLYAYTRIKSIARNANLDGKQIRNLCGTYPVSLQHPKEWKLGKILIRYTDVLLQITKDLLLHHLCEYVYEIATAFTEFYDVCYCIEKNPDGQIVKINYGRILLAECTAVVLEQCFHILGLKPVCKM